MADSVRELLERARHAASPPPAASARVRARVLAAIVPSPPAGPTGAGDAGLGGLIASGAKILAVVGVTVAVGLRLATMPLDPPREAPPTPSAVATPDVAHPSPKPVAVPPAVEPSIATRPDPAPQSSVARAPDERARPRSKPVKSTLADELASLAEVNDALARGDVGTASTQLRTHHTRFPTGQMRSEAMVLDILVAARAGRSVTASCERFAAAFPGSLHDRRAATICADSGSAPRTAKPP